VINVACLPISWTILTAHAVIPGTSGLYGTGKKAVCAGQFIVLGDFVGRCMVRGCSRLRGSLANV